MRDEIPTIQRLHRLENGYLLIHAGIKVNQFDKGAPRCSDQLRRQIIVRQHIIVKYETLVPGAGI